jgi:hypothetical protein
VGEAGECKADEADEGQWENLKNAALFFDPRCKSERS